MAKKSSSTPSKGLRANASAKATCLRSTTGHGKTAAALGFSKRTGLPVIKGELYVVGKNGRMVRARNLHELDR